MTQKLWGGRFRKKTDPRFEKFSASLCWDSRLLPYDLQIDAVHVQALQKCGVLTAAEAKRLLAGIRALQKRARAGSWKPSESFEDIHSAIQAELTKRGGSLADKLHTARSRNDLVSQSTRLYCKDHAAKLVGHIRQLQKEIVRKAERYEHTLVPGMTHMQNAQVVSQAHIFLAYAEMLDRARMRLEAARPFFDTLVLGSGALAGVTFALDREWMAKKLGLSNISYNSYDAAGDRDFVLSALSGVVFTGLQLSRIAEDLMIGQTRGFSLVDVDESFCTGSSMMPQKKNADFLELTRGAAGVFTANFVGMLTTLKGLPTSYNRDLQWDKKFLFDSIETCEDILDIFTRMFATLKINEKRAAELLDDASLYATDLADHLAKKGVPFKEAHAQVGRLVSFSEREGVPLQRIGLDILRKFAPSLSGDAYNLFDGAHSVGLKRTSGSTRPSEVKKQIAKWKKILKS